MTIVKKCLHIFAILLCIGSVKQVFSLRILHLSFHKGCLNEINLIAQRLDIDVTPIFIPDLPPQAFDGKTAGNALYNIGHERALNIWNKHKDYFNEFDAIITSDTAPLSRIFLQNNYTKPLIIWVCNRFDYADTASLDCTFPDEEYYELMRQAKDKKNVYTVPYNSFESFYAIKKNITFNNSVIKPSGIFTSRVVPSAVAENIDRSQTFFIPPYLNDKFMNLSQECFQLDIPTYTGRYNGPNDLKGFKGIIHIPYAWSNVAFFENMHNGLPYFVPSIHFMLKYFEKRIIWWPNGNYFENHYHLSEWYNDEYSNIITYFDSWQDLKNKIESTDFDALQTKIKYYAQTHLETTLQQWKKIFDSINNNQ